MPPSRDPVWSPPRRRVRVSSVLQMEAVECGAACLAMILGYHGRHEPLETLRYACGVSRDGTSAANVLRAARGFGLVAKGFSVELQALNDFTLPFMVFSGFNHFIVVEGFGRDRVYLNDPAAGRRSVAFEEFDRLFTGIVLTFEPGPEFRPGGHRPSARDGLLRRLDSNRKAFAFIILSSLGLILPGILVPALTRIFVDYYLIQGVKDWLKAIVAGLIFAALLRALLFWLRQHYLLRLQTRLALNGSCAFFWHLLRLPARFFGQRYAGDIAARLSLNDRIAGLIAGDLAIAVVGLVTMVAYAGAMAGYDPVLTGLAVLFALLNLGAFIAVARDLAESAQKQLLNEGRLLGVATQGLQMIESIKAAGAEDLFFSRWAGYLAKAVNTEQELSRVRLKLGSSPTLLAMLGSATILVVGGQRVMTGAITIGTLVAFQSLMTSFTAPLIDLVRLGGQLQEVGADIIRLDDIESHDLDPDFATSVPVSLPQPQDIEVTPPSPADKPLSATAISARSPAFSQPEAKVVSRLSGRVQIRNLTFGHVPTDAPLVQGFHLDLEPGRRIALVGPSGSGKSTIGKLIAGLYRPWDGEILFDGLPMSRIPRVMLRNSVALVDQDIVLFTGSVADNIALWDQTMPEDRIVLASRDARIHDEIAVRPDNYAFELTEGGNNFSGGQRQRIELARALAAEPTVLILDEATSALDTTSEKQIIDNVRRRGCSCVIIAHRLSTIRDCDEILVLERGSVVERGTHQDLLAGNGVYRRLVES